jgi:aminoglycoside 3-N-acetyltransferase
MENAALAQLRDDLLALGVRPGGVLMVHSSLRSLGQVAGGAETVIAGLLAAIGAEGTLLMPALTYERVIPTCPVFDVRHTPGNVGIIPETFRLRPGTLRSVHPTHSVCGVGPLAAALLEPHLHDGTPCGPHSPFHTLPQHNGQILMLGCGLEPNTSMHAIEELVVPPYLYAPPITYHLTLADGSARDKAYTPHNFRGWQQRYERVENILAAPALRRGPVLAAEACLIDAAALWEAALAALHSDALYFVAAEQTSAA